MIADRRANELRDEFNSIISHELRTPITAIYGGAKLLASRDRRLDDVARTEIIEDLEAESDRLYRLVEDLLVLAKSERGTIDRDDRASAAAAPYGARGAQRARALAGSSLRAHGPQGLSRRYAARRRMSSRSCATS